MIFISDKHKCCGCEACVQRCPKNCILLREDKDGFLYPQVDTKSCINCHLCEKVCPMLHEIDLEEDKKKSYVAINTNEAIRLESSSGGLFTAFAEYVIKKRGVVFGVQFGKDWCPEFSYTENIEGLHLFRGSKYIQARIGTAYRDVELFLKQGRKVLFTGCSCHIKALHLYLSRYYSNLLTVDLICHGVPSPGVWRHYLKTFNPFRIEKIEFRNKKIGWKKYSFVIQYQDSEKANHEISMWAGAHSFTRLFLSNICIRPSCYNCQSKNGRSGSDITIADAWGIEKFFPEMDDDKGTSLVIVHSLKGEVLFNELSNLKKVSVNINDMITYYNTSYIFSVKPNPKRKDFFENYQQYESLDTYVQQLFPKPSRLVVIKGFIMKFLRHVFIRLFQKKYNVL